MKRNIQNISKDEENIKKLCMCCQEKTLAHVIHYFVKCGGANVTTNKGRTPLMFACRNKNWDNAKDIVAFLLSNGADYNVMYSLETNGISILHLAVWSSSLEVVQLLVNIGHPINPTSPDGIVKSPLSIVAERKDAESIRIARFLIENGADLSARNVYSQTPLFLACYTDAPIEMVKLLGPKGHPCINAADTQGVTPLYLAIERAIYGDEYVSYLMSAGASTAISIPGVERPYNILTLAFVRNRHLMRSVRPFVSPEHIQSLASLVLPVPKCMDVLGVMREAQNIHKKPFLVSNFRWALEIKAPPHQIWAILRMASPCLDGSHNDYFVALRNLAPTDERLWRLMAETMASGRHPMTGDTLLHSAVRGANLDILYSLQQQMTMCPFLLNHAGETPMDIARGLPQTIANKPLLISALQDYSAWKPTVVITNWYGPFFRARAKTFLLICRRLKLFPRDLVLMILGYLANTETV